MKLSPKKEVDSRAYQLLVEGTRDQRLFLCSLDPKYFAIYYFPEFFDYKSPMFHLDFYDDARRLIEGELDEAAWIAFRESAKTSIAKIAFITWAICFRKKRYIKVGSYDKENAESLLFDVTVALQTNKRIIEDFGHLFYRKATKEENDEEGSKMKRLSSFVTENKIKVEAHSTQESTRGRVYKNFRPDLYLMDDIENDKTIKSFPTMASIQRHVDELISGLAPGACVLWLGNLIFEDGVVAALMERLRKNPLRAVVRNIPVMDQRGVIAWPDKYVKTDAERDELNKTVENPRRRKVSLESKRRQLTDPVFEKEMMNNPGKAGDYVFDREKVKRAMLTAYTPIKTNVEFQIWKEFQPGHEYAGGGDTSEGIGKDANASAFIDFTSIPNCVVATFQNNLIKPNIFGKEFCRQGNLYGECLLCPEINNTGHATLAAMQDEDYGNIYQREDSKKVNNQLTNEYGWRSRDKYELVGPFKTAFEDGELEIYDLALLTEMLHYTKNDLNRMKDEEGVTRHFDKLQAAMLAYRMKKTLALMSVDEKKRRGNIFKSRQKKAEPLY